MNWDTLIANGTGIVQFLVVLGLMVLFHEFGHLLVARLVGMRVYEFSIGFFRPALYSMERGGVVYSLRPVPLGGYVRIAGMEPGDEDVEDGYNTKPLWARALVVCAGSAMNLVLAALFFWAGFALYGQPQTGPFEMLRSTTVAERVMPNRPAYAAGLRPGDRVVSINGRLTATPLEASNLIRPNADKQITVTVLRGGTTLTVEASCEWAFEQWLIANGRPDMRFRSVPGDFVYPPLSHDLKYREDLRWGDEVLAIEGMAHPDALQVAQAARQRRGHRLFVRVKRGRHELGLSVSPEWLFTAWAQAERVGGFLLDADRLSPQALKAAHLQEGDWVVGIDGVEGATSADMILTFMDKDSVPLTVVRGAQRLSLTMTPKPDEAEDIRWAAGGEPIYEKQKVGRIGVAWHTVQERMSPLEQVSAALGDTYTAAVFIPKAILWVVQGKLPREVGGPIRIGAEVVRASYLGPQGVIHLAGFISVNLAIINMAPIPALDGFWMAMVAYETMRRKPLNRRAQAIAVTVGFFVLVGVFVLVTINDLVKLL
jgi:regulator of sigma E protease